MKSVHAEAPPVQSAAEIDYPPFSFVYDDGTAGGFSVELFNAVLAVMGREASFRTGPWHLIRGWLKQGDVQALPLVGRTPEREPFFDFTFPYMTLKGAIVVRADTDNIQRMDDLRGKIIFVMKGDNAEEFIRRKDRGINIKTTDTFQKALQGLSEGRADAVVMQRIVALRLIEEGDFTNLKIVNRPIHDFKQEFCFAVREGDRETLALLNEGLATIMADGTYQHLHAKWFAALELPMHRRIVFGGDANYPPFEYLDEHGRPAGYNVKLTRAIARELDLDIEIRLAPWAEIRKALAKGELDALQGMVYSPERDLIFDFSPPHTVTHYVGVVRKGEALPLTTLGDLAGKRIVVEKADIMHDFAIENGLDDQVTSVVDQEAALRALISKDQDVALVSRLTALYYIKKHGWNQLVVGRRALLSAKYCYAVPQNRQALLAQLSEGLNILDRTGEYRRIYEKWMGGYEDSRINPFDILKYTSMIVLPLLALLLAFLAWSWALRRQVVEKTKALQESLARFQHVFKAANVGKSITLPTGEVNANQAFADFLGYTLDELNGKRWQDLTLAEDIAITEAVIDSMIEGESDSARFEKRYVHKNGEPLWADVSAAIWRNPDDGSFYFMTTVVDISARKKTEALLRESEEKYRILIESAGDAIFIAQLGKIIFANQKTNVFSGYTQDELIGKDIVELIHPDDRNLVSDRHFKRLRNQVPPPNYPFRMLPKSGAVMWVDLSVTRIHWHGKSATLNFLRDVTERMRAEQALRESERRFRTLFEQAPIGIGIVSPDGIPIYVNRALQELLGYSKEGLRKDRFIRWTHPDDVEKSLVLVARLRQGETDQSAVDNRYLHADGSVIWARTAVTAVRDEKGELEYFIAMVENITERKKSQEALQASEKALKQAQQMAHIGNWHWDMETNRHHWSKEIYSIYGRDPALPPALYPEVSEYFTKESWAGLSELVERALVDGEPYQYDAEVVRSDGNHRYITIRGKGDCSRDGKVIRQYGTIQDITERIQLEKEKIELQNQLHQAQKMEAIGRLAGGVAHDYNNMLSVIIGYAELALEAVDPDDPIHADIGEILFAGNRSKEISRQLLAFARQQTVAPKVLDLNETIESMLKMLRRLIGEDVDLSWNPKEGVWPIKIDPTQIDQILANLCVNARDAIQDVGRVIVETGKVTIDKDYCDEHSEFAPGDFVMLAVSDNGCGMDKKTRDKIFEPFFTTKRVGQGTGLGLSTVYGIVKQNEGFINVYSEPGQGTTFKIYIPRYAGRACHDTLPEMAEIPVSNGETILIVEDERSTLKLTERILTSLGYRVLVSNEPDTALRLAEAHVNDIALVVTDVVMPGINGRDLATRLQARATGLKCLFMSGYTADVIAHRGVLEEGVHFVQKPFTKRDIAFKVREVLDYDEC